MKIAVLVSGGVDSAVALRLLQEQNHELVAFYIKIWLEDELAYLGDCPWQEDLSYVQNLCSTLNIPLRVVSLQKEYQQEVVAHAIDQIKAGYTPNPDIWCNSRIKFGLFFNIIDDSFEKVATGHYAQVVDTPEGIRLGCAPDPIKDQTYFLSHLTQAQLRRACFPIGIYTKAQVRALAHAFDLPNKDRKDSQGICFLGNIKFRDFVKHHLGERQGNLIEYETNKVVGTHQGFWFYTIGQRQGLGLGGGPWYVVAKHVARNEVIISRAYYINPQRNAFLVEQCHWIEGHWPASNIPITVKLRHGAVRYACTIEQYSSHGAKVLLSTHDQGISDGQFAVFYTDERCLGAGVMKQLPLYEQKSKDCV